MFTFLRLMLTAAQGIGAVVFGVLIACFFAVLWVADIIKDAERKLAEKSKVKMKHNAETIFNRMDI